MRRAKLTVCRDWDEAIDQITKRAHAVKTRLAWVKGDDLRVALEEYHAHLVQMRKAAKDSQARGQALGVTYWWELTPDIVRSRHIRNIEAAKFGGYPLQVFGKIL